MDPTQPGPDAPPIGHSLFDALFVRERQGAPSYHIPFPFTELVERIRGVVNDESDRRDAVKQVLIPLGRSLQRHAAAPHYFKYPRVVLAVDGESAHQDALLLKDRLFLGYQERANIIEVISYNNAAGRFEFQIVRNYGPDLKPEVFYTRRAVCMSCHQNGGPIFSTAAWSETPANPKVARRLLDLYRTYSGVPVNQSANSPFAIDEATDRANLLALYQLLWRHGCGDDDEVARVCRATAFTAALQHRLSGGNQHDTQSLQYRDQFLVVLRKSWERRWPQGIKIPTADIPNRDPIQDDGRIPARLDPLTPRSPLERWSLQNPGTADRLIAGMSKFLTSASIEQLDGFLVAAAAPDTGGVDHRQSACTFDTKVLATASSLMSFNCTEAAEDGFAMTGRLYVSGDEVTDGVVDELNVAEGGLRRLGFPRSTIESNLQQRRVKLFLRQQRSGLHARLPSGDAVQAVELNWSVRNQDNVGATLYVLSDFTPVQTAIAGLANEPEQSVFALDAFDGNRVMDALLRRLGQPSATVVCCTDAAQISEPRVDVEPVAALGARTHGNTVAYPLLGFFRYCSTCHQSPAIFPPNFLYGNPEQVAANIAQCAQRIGYRLQMWRLEEEQRVKSPMPPVMAVHGRGFSIESWRQNREFINMQKYISGLLQSRDVSDTSLLSRDYMTLPECMLGSG